MEGKPFSTSLRLKAYPQITAVFNAAKDNRRQQLEAEIRALGFRPGEGKKPPTAAVKFRSKADPSKTWAGHGAEPTWLKQEMQSSGLALDAFRVT
jgi:DNA-binding protein H-NS